MKIICIGQNYRKHNQELGNEDPLLPVVFLKPDSSLLRKNSPFYIPDFSREIHFETELVVRIDRLGKNISPKFAHRYYSEIGLGIDFTARDLQRSLRAEGKPWEIAKSFDNSAVVGKFLPVARFKDVQSIEFSLKKNGEIVQTGSAEDMIFSIADLISYISGFFTLKTGDLIFTGTPAGVGAVAVGDHLEGFIYDERLFHLNIK
ncbi:MAG: fumarylacetoacetate hydrolase family protein [Prevotellaceae bacterium]|jgi:2-keto-4-pentenoate hydratase/2-oxohepta-3-ene-1,7-dioic acid hydratase in catechol pathway|nr:fumarylacetoacetate hydrolase family protein [Prevotellaceae bacterium]